MTSRSTPPYCVAIFAYNEEQSISRCIESIVENSDDRLQTIYVLANGCTDKTSEVVTDISGKYPKVKLVEISLGDKCNTWNRYIHDIADLSIPIHFFVDGDVWFGGDVFTKLSKQLTEDNNANAAAGVPLTGRHQREYMNLITERFCLFGNCYALKSIYLQRIRNNKFRLPRGLMWIDSAITKAVNSDIGNPQQGFDDRIIHDPTCGYHFESLRPLVWKDIRLYLSRITRYQTGKLQETYLEKLSFADWPDDMTEINKQILRDIQTGKTRLSIFSKRFVISRLKRMLYSSGK